ncbi:hypothetical protein C8F04DRAFT_1231893 [Mycena alexandri]|uniref:Uncharacterized protein n=1 Tax=Mycena alexandri TaxID=1745969 RepID=A0AAD6T2Y5_9AGAR|nr:hypothetical protein C8F04DRAFT_1231893 [Mycena alexandri]
MEDDHSDLNEGDAHSEDYSVIYSTRRGIESFGIRSKIRRIQLFCPSLTLSKSLHEAPLLDFSIIKTPARIGLLLKRGRLGARSSLAFRCATSGLALVHFVLRRVGRVEIFPKRLSFDIATHHYNRTADPLADNAIARNSRGTYEDFKKTSLLSQTPIFSHFGPQARCPFPVSSLSWTSAQCDSSSGSSIPLLYQDFCPPTSLSLASLALKLLVAWTSKTVNEDLKLPSTMMKTSGFPQPQPQKTLLYFPGPSKHRKRSQTIAKGPEFSAHLFKIFKSHDRTGDER